MSIRVYLHFVFLFSITCLRASSQYNPQFYLRATEAAQREKTQSRIIENVILKNLSLPLSEETEENWEGAFNAMEVLQYQDAFTWQKMQEAMTALPFHSITFQRHVLEAAYAMYSSDFVEEASALLQTTTDPKIFGMCAVYLLKSTEDNKDYISLQLRKTFGDSGSVHPILASLLYQMYPDDALTRTDNVLKIIFGKSFLPGETLLFSIQRKYRDFPGLALIRKKNGEFVKLNDTLFYVPQLARGIADLPFFLTKGNTPQGIFRMYGFGVSQSPFIGPTANIQMGMPAELSKEKYFNDKRQTGQWSMEDYAKLLPSEIRGYRPLYEAYYAGLAGRNEIIAHGTTINPEYYKGRPYYPMTPTEGCLSTKEFWDGKLLYSDQEKLVNALLTAGGAGGYAIVIELDDRDAPVTISELKKYFF